MLRVQGRDHAVVGTVRRRGCALRARAEMKLIVGSDGCEELYRVDTDPRETCNVVAEYPEVADRLRFELEA